MDIKPTILKNHIKEQTAWRSSRQPLLPVYLSGRQNDSYDIYPVHAIDGETTIYEGYKKLAAWMAVQKIVLIDGYAGVCWMEMETALEQALHNLGVKVVWHPTTPGRKMHLKFINW